MKISNKAKQKLGNSFVRRVAPLINYKLPLSFIQSIDVEPIAVCDLACSFCQVPGWDRAKNTRAMKLEVFKSVIDRFPNLKYIKLQGMGEPFLNKQLVDMVEYSSSKNIPTDITTHGGRLNSELIKGIIKAKLDFIDFSFDGATKATYEKARINSNYEKVTTNIKSLCEEKQRQKSQIRIQLVCLVSNNQILEEIPALVSLGVKLGVDSVHIKGRIKKWEKLDQGKYDFSTFFIDQHEHYDNIMNEAKLIAKQGGIKLDLGKSEDAYSRDNPCRWPWKSLYISTEGKVVPCCVVGVPETWNMGSLHEQSLGEIWNSKEYKKLRKQMSLHSRGKLEIDGLNSLCQSCYLSH